MTKSKLTTEGTREKSKAGRQQRGIDTLKKVTVLCFPPLLVSSFEGRARSSPRWRAAKTHRNSKS